MFLLYAIQWSLQMSSCPFLSLPELSPTQKAKTSLITADLRILEEVFNRFKSLAVDSTEFACLKAIVLFKPGETYSLLSQAFQKCTDLLDIEWTLLASDV